MIGKSTDFVFEPASYVRMVELVPQYVSAGHFENLEMRLRRKDGSVMDTLMSAVMEPDPGGGPILSRVTLHNITERKQMENALRLANAELARAMRVKDEFLANVSHELRTPLNGILTFAETLINDVFGPLNERQAKALSNIDASGRHLLALINDLLDLSRFEAGGLPLHREHIVVRDVCLASLIFVKEIAAKKRIQVTFDNTDAPASVFADGRRLKQMLVNLLGNAVKFTPEDGQVQLKVNADSAQGTINFAVLDTGPGISTENQQHLFRPFTQLESNLATEGTGLGLALVKRLAEQHGGSVCVESAGLPGQGSRFTITLPMIEVEFIRGPSGQSSSVDALDLAALAAPGPGATVLLVEDDEMMVTVVSEFLERLAYRVITARTGPAGLAYAQAEPPDLILMDMQLPEMNGLEVIQQLRRDPHFAVTPIVAVTALAMTGDRERCLQAGASHYMSKPLVLAELGGLIKSLLAASP
ncbi:MAG: response regulator [Anaerolineales bacterium]|nr:response regulator [Anaerolineales bacterium]